MPKKKKKQDNKPIFKIKYPDEYKKSKRVVGKALLEYKTGINNYCSVYDPLGLCHIEECLYCSNCFFKITYENGQSISTYGPNLDELKSYNKDSHEYYVILFYNVVPKIEDVYRYIFDVNNKSYEIIRINHEDILENEPKGKQKVKSMNRK